MGEKPSGVSQADWDEANNDGNKAKKLEHSELKNRQCTDIPCCIVFLAFLVTIVGLGYVGFMEGDTSKLATPFDFNGRECGKLA
jgi:hypothetical protein